MYFREKKDIAMNRIITVKTTHTLLFLLNKMLIGYILITILVSENVGKQALKDHIILVNPEKFWELVLNAIR